MNLLLIISTLIVLEASDSNFANTSEQAVGCLKIKPCVVTSVNSIYGTDFKLSDRKDRVKSVKICKLYLIYWGEVYTKRTGKPVTPEIYVRIWKGGPFGWTHPDTINFWNKAKYLMEGLE